MPSIARESDVKVDPRQVQDDVYLNIEGQRYTATFRIDRDVITVSAGQVSKRLDLVDTISPKSVARTLLRSIILEQPASRRGRTDADGLGD